MESSSGASASCNASSTSRPEGRRRAACALAAGALLALACGDVPTIHDCVPRDGVAPVCGFTNPEDLVVTPDHDWLIVSQLARQPDGTGGPGSLVAYRPRDGARRALYPDEDGAAPAAPDPSRGAAGCTTPPPVGAFLPHGIDLRREGDELLVVNHGREAIEVFALEPDAEGPRLRWLACVPLPEAVQANDVASLPDRALVATDFMPREAGLLTFLRIALGAETGELLVWSHAAGWQPVPGSRASAPNGVAASADGQTLWFAEWGASRLGRIGRDGSGRRDVPLSFHPDNLSWAGDGALLVAGQRAPVIDMPRCAGIEAGGCGLASVVVSVDPQSLAVTPRLDHDPATALGASSAAVDLNGTLWIGAFAGDRIGRLEE